MIKRLSVYILSIGLVFSLISPAVAVAAPATHTSCKGNSVLLFPPWFKGLKCENDTVQITDINEIWVIVMNIVQWLIIAGGYVALFFIITAGFKYIMASGDPQKIASAKNTIINAIIGLVIVLASVAIVQTIQAGIIRGELL